MATEKQLEKWSEEYAKREEARALSGKSQTTGSTCGWFHEDADFYSTQCGKVQISISDGEGDELYKYCPHCAGLIVLSNATGHGECAEQPIA